MKLSLRARLSTAFIVVALVLFVLISLLANFFLDKQFKEYTIHKQDQRIGEAARQIAAQYQAWGGRWYTAGIENIGVNLLGEGLIIRVKDADGRTVWDARVHNNGMCTAILENMAKNMQEYKPDFKGDYTEKNYPLASDGLAVGSVDIGYYGPYFYSDTDIQFLGTLNSLLLIAAAVSLVLCLLLGAFMARRLTRPIERVIHATGKIAGGDYADRIHEKSNTKEIIELTGAVNSLAGTLGDQEKLRKRLTADVAHEFRTPLATLQSHVEALIDGVWEPDSERLTSFHEEIARLAKLVGELEKLSSFEAENMALHKQPLDLAALLKRIAVIFGQDFKDKGVALALHAQEMTVEADKDKLSQVFVNLINNALKFTPAGGSVEIELQKTPDAAVVTFKDTGCGIPEKDIAHIFERFYRTDRSRSRKTGGFGIGLTISQAIMQAHGGGISVSSEQGKGSVFTVSLPL